jgi:hypothetical protein
MAYVFTLLQHTLAPAGIKVGFTLASPEKYAQMVLSDERFGPGSRITSIDDMIRALHAADETLAEEIAEQNPLITAYEDIFTEH